MVLFAMPGITHASGVLAIHVHRHGHGWTIQTCLGSRSRAGATNCLAMGNNGAAQRHSLASRQVNVPCARVTNANRECREFRQECCLQSKKLQSRRLRANSETACGLWSLSLWLLHVWRHWRAPGRPLRRPSMCLAMAYQWVPYRLFSCCM